MITTFPLIPHFIKANDYNFFITHTFTNKLHYFYSFHEFHRQKNHFHHFQEFQGNPLAEELLSSIPGIPGKSTDRRITSINSRNSKEIEWVKITFIISRNSREYKRGWILLTTSFTYCHISVTCPSYGGGRQYTFYLMIIKLL